MKYIAPLYLCVIIKLGGGGEGGEHGGLGVGGVVSKILVPLQHGSRVQL